MDWHAAHLFLEYKLRQIAADMVTVNQVYLRMMEHPSTGPADVPQMAEQVPNAPTSGDLR